MLSRKDLSFMNLARSVAEMSEQRRKHGAVVVKSGRVVGMGFNKFRNHPTIIPADQIKSHCSSCAEKVAIKNAGKNAKGAVIYVARVSNQGSDRMSKPCYRCAKLIKEAGIKRVIYTEESDYGS